MQMMAQKAFNINDYWRYIECDMVISYKSLKLHPVKLKDFYKFFDNIGILTIDKDLLGPELAGISYLEFLASIIYAQSIENGEDMFSEVMKLVLDVDDIRGIYFKFEENGKVFLIIDGQPFDRRDFDIIKRLILFQNIYGHNDRYVDPELAKALEEENRLKNKNNLTPSLEDQIVALALLTGFTYDYIYSLPIRKFFMSLYKSIHKMEYQIAKTGMMSGMVKFERPIEDWIPSNSGANMIGERVGEYGTLIKKINTK